MASSAETLTQIRNIQNQLSPLLEDQGGINDYFKRTLGDAFGNNLPLLKEGANLEANAYTLPGKLMDQYTRDFGSTFGGASGTARLNSVLGRLGSNFANVDLVNKLADQNGARIGDMAKSITDQYMGRVRGLQDQNQTNLSLYGQQLQSEDSAANRAQQAAMANRQNQALRFAQLPLGERQNPFGAVGQAGGFTGTRANLAPSQVAASNEQMPSSPFGIASQYFNKIPKIF